MCWDPICPNVSGIDLTVVDNVYALFDIIILGESLSSDELADLPQRLPFHFAFFKAQ